MRKILILFLCLAMLPTYLLAQNIEVTGRVTDDANRPVADATIQVKGTRTATRTDANGVYKINATVGSTLVITYIGFGSTEVEVTKANMETTALKAVDQSLSEVVVTALGIRREKKSLGYAVATVDKKALELRPDGDVVRLLNGKAPGVDIFNASGISGSGTNIVIRGVSTITGDATPLFIVDGVPFDASTNAQADFTRGNTTSSRFLDLDPNNIESISVLKGLSATTLYGELGRNGVVLVTTKNGASGARQNKGMEITVQQSLFANKVANLPVNQKTYGGGFDQSLGLAFFSNWGAKFTDPPQQVLHPYSRAALAAAFPQFQGAMYDYKYYDNLSRFFRTGLIKTTSVNVNSVGSNGSFNANYSYLDDVGFTPGNNLLKNTFGIGGTVKLANRVTVNGTMNYAKTNFKSPPTSTSFGSNPTTSSVFGNLIYTPVAVDLMGLPFENPLDKSSVYYRGGNDIQHPLWTVKNAVTGQEVDRVFGSMQLKYDITKNLNLSYRVGFDGYIDYNYLAQNKGGIAGGTQYQLGIYRTVNGRNTIWDHTVLANWKTNITSDWSLALTGGANSSERKYNQNGQKSTQQLVYGLFDHDNFIVHENTSEDGGGLDFRSATQSVGVFAEADFGYKDFLYLRGGGRNSWTSNLEADNRRLFFPSFSASFIPTAAFKGMVGDGKVINFMKVRASYATSANFGDPYSTRPTLSVTTNRFEDRTGTIINTNTISNRLANPNLKPELMKEYEIGIESKLVDNRVSFDLTVYRRTAKEQILDRDLDPATGYTVTKINAGSVRNQGIELALGYTVIRNKNWRWQLDGNFTLNRSEVTLPADVGQITVAGFTNEGLFAINGQPLGVIQSSYTKKYVDPSGKATNLRLVDANGNYVSNAEIGIIGDPTPDYRMTGISTLEFKGISFRMQWEYTQGGDILAYTPGTLVGRGITKDTEFDRKLPLILPGVKADGTPNDKQISASAAYFNNLSGFFGMQDLITYDATLVRLREVSLSYSLPKKWLGKTPIGSVQFILSGQNLFYKAPNIPKYTRFDPETSSLGVANLRGLEYLSGPTSKRFGGSIRLTF